MSSSHVIKKAPRDPVVTSRIMSAVRRRDSRAEIEIRRLLFALGLRYRVDDRLVYGRPDISFRGPRVAVFIDGDFWHGNAWKVRGLKDFGSQFRRMNNAPFWRAKLRRNMERDVEVNATLRNSGWLVIRVWESDIHAHRAKLVRRIAHAVTRRR